MDRMETIICVVLNAFNTDEIEYTLDSCAQRPGEIDIETRSHILTVKKNGLFINNKQLSADDFSIMLQFEIFR